MEPLDPRLREALKQAHAGLTDRDIDRYEELLARRAAFDPETDAEETARLDRERAELLTRLMPRYAEVAQAVAAELRQRQRGGGPRVRTTIKRPEP